MKRIEVKMLIDFKENELDKKAKNYHNRKFEAVQQDLLYRIDDIIGGIVQRVDLIDEIEVE